MLPDSHLEKAGYLNGIGPPDQKVYGVGAAEGCDLLILGNA
jgi:hypothetical protein